MHGINKIHFQQQQAPFTAAAYLDGNPSLQLRIQMETLHCSCVSRRKPFTAAVHPDGNPSLPLPIQMETLRCHYLTRRKPFTTTAYPETIHCSCVSRHKPFITAAYPDRLLSLPLCIQTETFQYSFLSAEPHPSLGCL